MPELAYIAIETSGGPHVTPVLHGRSGDRLWFMLARGTLKARVLARRPSVGVLVGHTAMAGRAELLDPLSPLEMGSRLPELACALPSLGRGNELELLGFARDALRAPGRLMPSNMLLVSVAIEREWEVDAPTGQGEEAVLGWLGPDGPLALPARWDAAAARARVGWHTVPAARTSAPACICLDESDGPGPAAKHGVLVRGRGSVAGGGSVRMHAERVSWWDGFDTGTEPVSSEQEVSLVA